MPDLYTSQTSSGILSKGNLPRSGPPKLIKAKTQSKKVEKVKLNKEHLHGHNHNPFSSFSLYPDKVKLLVKDPEEKIILLLRRHPITNIPWMIIVFFLVIVPQFFPLIYFYEFLPMDYRFLIQFVWYLATLAYGLEKFLQWFFNVNIVTDERLIDVDFHNFLHREISDANIDQIQDVSVPVGGGIRTFLNYGSVVIQTAAEVLRIEFEDVPQPDEVAKILRQLRVEEEQEKIEGRVR